jgi:hypothetical protein
MHKAKMGTQITGHSTQFAQSVVYIEIMAYLFSMVTNYESPIFLHDILIHRSFSGTSKLKYMASMSMWT